MKPIKVPVGTLEEEVTVQALLYIAAFGITYL
jgi:hypothetical protein